MKKIGQKLMILPAAMLLAGVAMPALPAYAANPGNAQCNNDAKVSLAEGVKCTDTGQGKTNLGAAIKQVTNVLLFILGAISVIMIIIGGIKYTISNGDSSAITSAKNTIMYAVIGLVVALLAYAIVNFVVDTFVAQGGGGGSNQTKTD